MEKSRIFLILSLSLILGIFLASFFKPDAILIYFLAIASIITLTLGYKNKIALVAGLAFLFLAFGIWRTETDLNKLNNLLNAGADFSGSVVVTKEPEQKENYQKIIAKTSDDLKVLINASQYLRVDYGEELKVQCNLKIPENKEDFDYRMYLAKDKIYYICQNAKFEKTGQNYGNKFYAGIVRLKNKMAQNVNRVIPYPQSALGNGLIFGGSSELPKNLKNDFSQTGMTHIVAVSGYNVTIIADYLMLLGIFLGLWRKRAFWFAVVGIFLFVAMIGFPSSAVRAAVMGCLLIWAMKNGRLANSWNAIISAGAVMLLVNPLLLRWDIGFQLSFLATLGIVALAPFWERNLARKHKAFGFTEIFFLTTSAQIFVMPIIIYNFHGLSLVSLAANLLILLIIPISMFLVFLAAVAGFIFGPLSLVFAWLAYLPLKYEVWIVGALGGLKWASKAVENFSWQWIVVWYLILFSTVYLLKKKLNAKQKSNLWSPDSVTGA